MHAADDDDDDDNDDTSGLKRLWTDPARRGLIQPMLPQAESLMPGLMQPCGHGVVARVEEESPMKDHGSSDMHHACCRKNCRGVCVDHLPTLMQGLCPLQGNSRNTYLCEDHNRHMGE